MANSCKDKIKEILSNDMDRLIYILEQLGCHHINPKFGEDELRCALPDGETSTSVSIRLNEFLGCYVFSRGSYDNYQTKDIITFVQFILGCGFESAVKWLCSQLSIEYDGVFLEIQEELEISKVIRKRNRKQQKQDVEIKHEILDDNILNNYTHKPIQEWIDEGITYEIQNKYKMCIDEKRMRYLIPIYDENFNLISIKGRGYMPNIKELNIPKYIYYYKLGVNDILFGLNFNKENIAKKREIILFEGEKSVAKADAYGYNWCCSVGKNGINPHLLKKILKLRCDVVIAFDKDVDTKKVYEEARKLNRYTNVFAIIDNENLLDINKKDSPVDKGKDVWERLYHNKRRII